MSEYMFFYITEMEDRVSLIKINKNITIIFLIHQVEGGGSSTVMCMAWNIFLCASKSDFGMYMFGSL